VNLARLTNSRLQDEVVGGAERIKGEIGHTPAAFAYPYGATNDAAVAIVASRFAWGCTTEMRWVSQNEARSLLPRIDMFYLRKHGQLERWGTARFRYHLSWRAGARLVRRHFHDVTAGR
jgi:peptidoglycan/xylan/chitin deacetylase (PgdA/CDA1 family)